MHKMIIIVIRGNIDKVSGFPDIVRVCKLLVVIQMFILLTFILAVFYILSYQFFVQPYFINSYTLMLPIAGRTAGAIGLNFFVDTHGCQRLKKFENIFFLKFCFIF